MTTILLRRVSRRLGRLEILRDVSLRFPEGRISLLLGPNGAGKTTLLRLAAFLDTPSAGSIALESAGDASRVADAVTALAPRRRVTMVFQRPVLFACSVRANLAYPLRVRGLPQPECQARIAQGLQVAALEPLAGQDARRLSGGEGQRLALARAYVIRPEVLLLDEPSANLDPASRERIEAMLRDMQARFGTTIVYASHDLDHARRIGQAVYFAAKGTVNGPYEVEAFFESPPIREAETYLRPGSGFG